MILVVRIIPLLNLNKYPSMVDWSLELSRKSTVTIELGMPVRRPDMKTRPNVGIMSSYSSSSWKFIRNLLISPFEPNCNAT